MEEKVEGIIEVLKDLIERIDDYEIIKNIIECLDSYACLPEYDKEEDKQFKKDIKYFINKFMESMHKIKRE